MNIKFKYKKFTFDLNFNGVISIVIGDSATGKSLFVEAISVLRRFSGNKLVIDDVHLFANYIQGFDHARNHKEDLCLIAIDESEISKNTIRIIKENMLSNTRIVLLCRDPLEDLAYGAEDVYIFQGIENRYIKTALACCELFKFTKSYQDLLLVEGEGLDFDLISDCYGSQFRYTDFACGRNNLVHKLKAYETKVSKVTVICDLCGLGSVTVELNDYIILHKKIIKVSIYQSPSFEYELLSFPFFKLDVVELLRVADTRYNREDFYENILISLFKNNFGMSYHKADSRLKSFFNSGILHVDSNHHYNITVPRLNSWFYTKLLDSVSYLNLF